MLPDCLKTAVKIIKNCAYQIARLVANKVSRHYRRVNTQNDKNQTSDEYLNMESKYHRKIVIIFNVRLAAIGSLFKLA